MNVQVLADPVGRLVWASPGLPGATHNVTLARTVGLIDALTSVGVTTFADKGYQGAAVRSARRSGATAPGLSRGQKDVNRSHARIRAIGERAVATLKTWKVPARLPCLPTPRDRGRPGHPRSATRRRWPSLTMKGSRYCIQRSWVSGRHVDGG